MTLYRWKQPELIPGQPGELYEGYFKFGIADGKLVLASVSLRKPAKLTGVCTLVDVATSKTSVRWNFGELMTAARISKDGHLYGRSEMGKSGAYYTWEATPVEALADDFAASLATVSASELGSFISESKFSYRPVLRDSIKSPFKFQGIEDLIQVLKP